MFPFHVVQYGLTTAMLTYTANDLWTLRHAKPPTRAVRKVIFSAQLWQPGRARESADRPVSIVNKENNARRRDDDICMWDG